MDTPKHLAVPAGVALSLLLILVAFEIKASLVGILSSALLLATIAISLQIVFALLGELSLGQAAFFGVASFGYALVTAHGEPVWLGILAGVAAALLAAGIMGFVLSRVQGAYFAVITYAITVLLAVVVEGSNVLGGSEGFLGVPALWSIHPQGANSDSLLYTGLAFMVSIALLYAVWRGGLGLSLEVTRADRRLARAIGINTRSIVVAALLVAAMPAALAGIAFAGTGLYVGPSVFSFYYIVVPLSVLAIGGTRSLAGSLTGSLLIVAVPLILNVDALTLQIIAGVFLAVIVIVFPRGLNGGIAGLLSLLPRSRSKSSKLETEEQHGGESPRQENGPLGESRTKPHPTAHLRASGIDVFFGGNHAVRAMALTVAPGEIVGLIGPNGAGKSTMVNALTGAVPSRGTITIGERDMSRLSADRRARAGLARTFQEVSLVEALSVRQSLVVAQSHGHFIHAALNSRTLIPSALEAAAACGLEPHLDSKVANLTNLHRRLLAIAMALASEPLFLLLDEATAGLSQDDRRVIAGVLREAVLKHGIGILVIEHDVQFVAGLCQRVTVMDNGALIADDSPDQVLSDKQVISSYLGRGWARAEG